MTRWLWLILVVGCATVPHQDTAYEMCQRQVAYANPLHPDMRCECQDVPGAWMQCSPNWSAYDPRIVQGLRQRKLIP